MTSWGGGQVAFHYKGSASWEDMHRLCFHTCLWLTHELYGPMYAYATFTAAPRVHRHIHEGAHVYIFTGSHAHLHVLCPQAHVLTSVARTLTAAPMGTCTHTTPRGTQTGLFKFTHPYTHWDI